MKDATLLILGAGNVGSHVLGLVARLAGIGAIVIVDSDRYSSANAVGQAILPGDVGRPKAMVMAARVRRQAPGIAVSAIHAPLESLPLGFFRVDLILACLDSRRARQHVNEIAFRAGGIPWIDAGVRADGLLARVTAYDPRAAASPCLECAWSDADYERLGPKVSCLGERVDPGVAPTNAPAALGALAAALQVLECEKLLRGREDRLPPGSEVLIDAASHSHYRTGGRRKASCRFDHDSWTLTPLGAGPSAPLATLVSSADAAGGGSRLGVAGQAFLTQLVCAECGTTRPCLRLVGALRPRDLRCAQCGHVNVPRSFDVAHELDAAALPAPAFDRPLTDLGLRSGDVVTVTDGDRVRHLVLDGAVPRRPDLPRRSV